MATSSRFFSLEVGPQLCEQYISPKEVKGVDDLLNLNHHLAVIHDFSREIKSLIQNTKKTVLIEETKRKMADIHASFEFIGHLSQSIEKRGLKKELARISVLGMAASEICHAGVQLKSLESISAWGPAEIKAVAAAAGAALTIFNVFKKKKKDPSDSFANGLIKAMNEMSNQLLHLNKEMRESFIYLSGKVNDMHIDMINLFDFSFQLFGKVLKTQTLIYQMMEERLDKVDKRFDRVDSGIHLLLENNRVLLQNIKQVESNAEIIQDKLDFLAARELIILLDEVKAISEGRLSVNHLTKAVVNLDTWREQTFLPAYNGSVYLKNVEEALTNRLKIISSHSTMIHFGLLFAYAKSYLGISCEVSSVFNPYVWNLITKKYIELKLKFPNEVIDNDDINYNKILTEANHQIKATEAFRSVRLFQSLFNQYKETMDFISKWIHQELKKQSDAFNEKEVFYKQTVSTPPFDIAEDLQEIVNEWKDNIPRGRHIEGHNLGFSRGLIEYNDFVPATINARLSTLLVLAERLNKINFMRYLNYITMNGGGPIKGRVTVTLGFRYGEEFYTHFHTRQYNTTAEVDPGKNGDNIQPHWASKVPTFDTEVPIGEEHIDKIKSLIFGLFLKYRKNAFESILDNSDFNQLLKQLDASRNLILHYSIAAGFKPELIAAMGCNVLGSHHIIFNIKKYLNEINKDNSDKDDILEVASHPLPIPFFSDEAKITADDVLQKIQSSHLSYFEKDILGNVRAIISDLKDMKQTVSSSVMVKPFAESKSPKASMFFSPKTLSDQTIEEKKIGIFADRITFVLGFKDSPVEEKIKNNLKQLLLVHKKSLRPILLPDTEITAINLEREKNLAVQLAEQLRSFPSEKLQKAEDHHLFDCIAKWIIGDSNELKRGEGTAVNPSSSEKKSLVC